MDRDQVQAIANKLVSESSYSILIKKYVILVHWVVYNGQERPPVSACTAVKYSL